MLAGNLVGFNYGFFKAVHEHDLAIVPPGGAGYFRCWQYRKLPFDFRRHLHRQPLRRRD